MRWWGGGGEGRQGETHAAPVPAVTLDLLPLFSFVRYSLFLISPPLAAKLDKDR
jgi:hypothetical protein